MVGSHGGECTLTLTFGCCVVFFFFSSRRRHTRFKCDWSSDVCSSDLSGWPAFALAAAAAVAPPAFYAQHLIEVQSRRAEELVLGDHLAQARGPIEEIGRAAWRGRGEISVGAGSFKKKKRKEHGGRRKA